MTDIAPHRLWPWVVAVVIGVPVLYVASFGPACWLLFSGIIPDGLTRTLSVVYCPLFSVINAADSPYWLKSALYGYAAFWANLS